MKNTYTFLRHGETIKDPTLHAKDWKLTEDALDKIQKHIDRSEFVAITKIFSSTEDKATATAKPIADLLGLSIIEIPELVEVEREKKFLTDEEFLDQKRRELTNLDKIENGKESAKDALNRFLKAIEKIENENENENILIVSHGTIITLYFSHLLNDFSPENVIDRWQKIAFCAVGKVEDGKIIKDII